MSLPSTLDSVVAVATLTLRITAVLFTQFHPLGGRYLNQIYASCLIYIAATLLQLAVQKQRRRRSPLSCLLFGHVDPSRPAVSILTALANAACIAATWDFLYRGHLLHQSHNLSFSRLGHLDASTARIVIRAPFDSPTPVQMALAGTSQQHVSLVSAETDFTATFLLDGLTPNTTYTYLTNASHTGTFTTPEEHPKRWSLASTSCIKPFYPYNPADHALRIRGLEHLARFHVDMVLFLGDFIYIDLPTSIGQTAGHYVSAYRQVYASPSWTDSLRSIPWLHMYDDHEIENDWDARESGLYRDAIRPYHDYQGGANPPSTMGAGETYYTFHRGGVSFFVLDNRRYRSPIGAPGAKTMLGGKQLADLNHWLDTEARWKVVVSGVPFTRNWRGPDSGDSWAGYLEERDVLLDRMKRTDGVIIISGDRHEHATTLFPAKHSGEKDVIEFSTSPLNQFYEPFSRFHRQIEDTDVSVFSYPWGNSKFGIFDFDTSNETKLDLSFRLIVDGDLTWSYSWTYTRGSVLDGI